jgi:hypothetical protein
MRDSLRKEGLVIVSFIPFLLNTGGIGEKEKRGTGEKGKGEG